MRSVAATIGLAALLGGLAACNGGADCPRRFVDLDGDGFGNTAAALEDCDAEGVLAAGDCDDANPERFPGADEACNGLDDDCDGEIDERTGVGSTTAPDAYLDRDRDGAGAGAPWAGCGAPPPLYTATRGDDCDDLDPLAYPGAAERCTGTDTDCDGLIDNGAFDATEWYVDADLDGFGALFPTATACTAEQTGFVVSEPDFAGSQGSQIVRTTGDCDDNDRFTYPGAAELCDGRDNDCDNRVDDNPLAPLTAFVDVDQDGWGGPVEVLTCDPFGSADVPGLGVVSLSPLPGDCDDGNDTVQPFAVEVCNGEDDNCNGLIDDDDGTLDLRQTPVWHPDDDGDGFGDPDRALYQCTPPADAVSNDEDCDDGDDGVNPEATEVCNGIDDDCDDDIDDDDGDLQGGPCL